MAKSQKNVDKKGKANWIKNTEYFVQYKESFEKFKKALKYQNLLDIIL